ncbi:MAG: trehalase, partial [Ignavibacteriales bacterium]|nr:trehalase [Ignavibacteriales bacterium]
HFWDGLTRRVDEQSLPVILSDEKTVSSDGHRYLYVPSSDRPAYDYFSAAAARNPSLRLRVNMLPAVVTPHYVRSIDGAHGVLTLALRASGESVEGVPFVVPGGRFNEMYGWDSYFITLGLLQDGKVDLAKSMVDNFVYQITHYGKILNANRTYYLTRSQPPFLTSMIRTVYEALPKNAESKAWLKTCLEAAMREYRNVWMSPQRTTVTGLQRYLDAGSGPPPEVEPGHFDAVFRTFARRHGMSADEFESAYRSGKIKDSELDRYFLHDRCMRESGHDTSYRLDNCCADLVTVDLNSLLYKIETDIAFLLKEHFGGKIVGMGGGDERSEDWLARAEKRKTLINRYLWDQHKGIFFDYSVSENRPREYFSATMLSPLWAGLASPDQAAQLVRNVLPLLEEQGGVVSSTEFSRGEILEDRPQRQWDYPYGWAPHQMLAWEGLRTYGYREDAVRLAYRWLYTITVNAVHYNGTVTEKYDVVKRSHQVFAEYGNVGTTFAYITREGFGWTNASYQIGLSLLPGRYRKLLDDLVSPEWIFPGQ